MNCPRCGSKLIEQVYQLSKIPTGGWLCKDNLHLIGEPQYRGLIKYQVKLDKLLEKFETPKEINLREEYDIDIPTYENPKRGIHIEYWSLEADGDVEHFKIGWNDYPHFSLKTVESYINDLEEMN